MLSLKLNHRQIQRSIHRLLKKKSIYLLKLLNSTVRSGQQVYAKDRDLIILGAVSHGAEVIADGNIHIYGALRGRAIAGAKGNTDAAIFCQRLEAELVSIDGNYWISDSLARRIMGQVSSYKLQKRFVRNYSIG